MKKNELQKLIEEVRKLQKVLDIAEKPSTVYNRQVDAPRGAIGTYEDWLVQYREELVEKVKDKLYDRYVEGIKDIMFYKFVVHNYDMERMSK